MALGFAGKDRSKIAGKHAGNQSNISTYLIISHHISSFLSSSSSSCQYLQHTFWFKHVLRLPRDIRVSAANTNQSFLSSLSLRLRSGSREAVPSPYPATSSATKIANICQISLPLGFTSRNTPCKKCFIAELSTLSFTLSEISRSMLDSILTSKVKWCAEASNLGKQMSKTPYLFVGSTKTYERNPSLFHQIAISWWGTGPELHGMLSLVCYLLKSHLDLLQVEHALHGIHPFQCIYIHGIFIYPCISIIIYCLYLHILKLLMLIYRPGSWTVTDFPLSLGVALQRGWLGPTIIAGQLCRWTFQQVEWR